MSKQFWGVIAIIILIFVGIFALSGKTTDSGSKSDSASLSQHVEGNPKASVTLVEYGDYQCPYCGQYYPTVKAIQTEFNDTVKFQFRNYPLVNVHQNAFAGSRAAEAASLQNKFWEMHDILYENQQTWSAASDPSSFFKAFAKQLGLNTTQFETDYASSKVNNVINADLGEGNKLAIQGTPSFFLNGKQVQIANTTAAFEKVIKEALSKQGVTNAGTTSQTTGTTTDSSAKASDSTTTTTSGQ